MSETMKKRTWSAACADNQKINATAKNYQYLTNRYLTMKCPNSYCDFKTEDENEMKKHFQYCGSVDE